jgi:transcriptional regulator with XRE-family HTH domain
METGLVDALAKAAKSRREEKDISKERVADALGKSVDAVRRFEGGGAFSGLNDVLRAYDTAGVSLLDLLDEVRANLKKSG